MATRIIRDKIGKNGWEYPTFPAFPESEHRERLRRAQVMLREAGFAGCICVAPENLFYLGGYDSISYFNQQALVFSVEEAIEPTLVIRNVDLSLALETSWVQDIRTYHLFAASVPEVVADVVREKRMLKGRIGIDLQSYALPGTYALGLVKALAPLQVEDVTDLLGSLQFIKSEREMAYLREAAGYAKAGLEAARKTVRSGITEIELAAAIEGAMRAAGSDYWAVPTEIASGPRTAGGHAAPLPRTLEQGDLVHFEFAGVARRYHVPVIHTMAIGDPGPRAREIYDLTIECLRAGVKACKPGTPVVEIDHASLEPLRREGLEHAAMMRFGVGIGIGYPPVWVGSLQIDRYSNQVLEVGMVFYLHAAIELVEERIGTIHGATYALTASGLETLAGSGDIELEIA
jgi:Xaa-Pro aminopeptidase